MKVSKQIAWELERMNEEQRKAFIKANSDAYETIIDKTRKYIQCMTHQCKNCIYEKDCFKNLN